MAKNDNIIDFLGDVADAIREKKGTTDPIAAQDFADEIKNIETDGMRYFDVRGFECTWLAIAFSCSLVKDYESSVGWMVVTPGMHWGNEWHPYNVGAIAVDNREVIFGDNKMTILNFIKTTFDVDIEATFPEITEEEFYDLTWEAPIIPEK